MVADLQAYNLDNYKGPNPSDADLTAQLNWALRLVSRRVCLWDPAVIFTLKASQATCRYDTVTGANARFAYRIVRPHLVVIAGDTLYGPTGYPGLWTMGEMDHLSPSWRSEGDGVPCRAIALPNHLRIWPAPDAATVAAGNSWVSAQILAPDLSATDDAAVPMLPEVLHEPLAMVAAFKSALPVASDASAWTMLKAFSQDAWAVVEEVRRENLSMATDVGDWQMKAVPDYMDI